MNAVQIQIEQYMLEVYGTIDYNELNADERIDVDNMRDYYENEYYKTLDEYDE